MRQMINAPIFKETSYVMDTQCPFCSVQCKMRITKELPVLGSSRPSYVIEGIPNAASEGRLCVKGMNAHQHAASSDRLLQPLVRMNGQLVPASWEEALLAISSKFRAISDEHGPDSLGVYGGGSLTNESAYLLGKFARVALGTKYVDYNGRFCMSAAASAGNKTFGIDRGLTCRLSDIPLARCIILAGTNIAECQPTLMPYFNKAKENGAVIIVIDPRVTATAAIADIHLQIKPGTDAALANGLLKVLLDEKLMDEAFIANRTTGFAELKEHLSTIQLDEVANLTGLDEAAIRKAGMAYGQAETGIIFTARGVEQQTDGHVAVRNFLNLVLAAGKVGKPGCGYGAVTGQGNGQGGREHGQKSDQLPGYRNIEEQDRAYVAGVWGVDPKELPRKGVSAYEMMELVHQRVIRSLFVMGSNPIVSNPNANLVEEGLQGLDFLVVADMFLSETAKLADVVLPVTAYLENDGTLTNLEGRVLLRESTIAPPGETRHDWAILCQIAEGMGKQQHFSFESAEQIFEELRLASRGGLADYYGITYDRLRREGGVYWPCTSTEEDGNQGMMFMESFAHLDGRAIFMPVASRLPQETPSDEFPLTMTNGRVLSHYLTGVQTRRSPSLAARNIENYIEIHPKTAQKHRIEDGEWVEVTSLRGSFNVRSRITDKIREDTLFVPMHWGGVQNVNKATSPELDPNCKMPGFKTSTVAISPLRLRK
jgi:assimilatory nitrate reductase catalytic subunit